MNFSPDQIGGMSLGQWAAVCSGWNKAHGSSTPEAPTNEEFEQAVRAARKQ